MKSRGRATLSRSTTLLKTERSQLITFEKDLEMNLFTQANVDLAAHRFDSYLQGRWFLYDLGQSWDGIKIGNLKILSAQNGGKGVRLGNQL